jgi:NADH-quinone oxidoreductase subunit J
VRSYLKPGRLGRVIVRAGGSVSMDQAFFLLFAAASVIAALTMVLSRNPVHSALALMACFLQISAIFVLLEAPLLAVIQIFVYVGAIMVLFLFVIMMIDVREAVLQRFLPGGNLPALALLVLLGVEMFVLVLWSDRFAIAEPVTMPTGSEIRRLSTTLFADYLLPFEVASVILLAALVGAIVLARKEPA